MLERIIRRKAVLEMLGISSATLHRRIAEGKIEPPLRIGANSVGWKLSTIQAVIDSYQHSEPIPVAIGAKRGRKPRKVEV